MDDKFVQFAANEILRYLVARPDSADTIEGIHQWWICWPGLPESMSVTAAALQQLEKNAMMQRIHIGNREIWRRLADPSEATD